MQEEFISRGAEVERLNRIIHQLQKQLRSQTDIDVSQEQKIYELTRQPLISREPSTPRGLQVQEFQEKDTPTVWNYFSSVQHPIVLQIANTEKGKGISRFFPSGFNIAIFKCQS
jgi:hypothetical protein